MNRRTAGALAREVSFALLAALFLVPVYVLINTALMPTGAMTDPLRPTPEPTLANAATAWVRGGLGGALVNNLVITLTSVLLLVVTSAMAAYPLARITRRWTKWYLGFFLAGLLVPMLLAMIPLYTTFRDLGLLGSVWALVVIYLGVQMPFSVFLYTQFMRSLPLDYEEAAALDGAGAVHTFFLVVLPLVRPVTGTVAVLNAVFIWNDFFTPLLYLGGGKQVTVSVALYSFTGIYASDWNVIFAGLIIASLPILVFYLFAQRHIIKGFAGGLKA